MNPIYQNELNVAVTAVREAAVLCQAVQDEITDVVLEKKDRSPVTVADFGSQALVCRALAEAFPNDPVIAEEDSAALRATENAGLLQKVVQHVRDVRTDSAAEAVCHWIDHGGAESYCDRFWTLDPIDGTKGFLRQEQYAIALALIVKGEVTVAALACPKLPLDGKLPADRGALFTAVRGQSAQMRAMQDDTTTTIQVTANTDPAAARFCESVESGHSSHGNAASVANHLGITTEPVRLDSQAKYAVVARGQADLYLRLPVGTGYVEKIWDHAAGALIVSAAGGTVTDIHGQPLEFTHGSLLTANRGIIVTNGHLHEPVINALRQVGVS